jgi:hypothetical protein
VDPVVDTVSVAVPVSLATAIVPTEQVGAGLCVGLTLHVNVTPDGLNPFEGEMVMLAVADCPGETEAGDSAAADSLKSAVTLIALEVLALKLLSPLYAAVMLWEPSLKLVVEIVAVPFALSGELPSWVEPSLNFTLPVGVPATVGTTLAVNTRLPSVELELSDVVVLALPTTWLSAGDVLALKLVVAP